LRPNSPDAIYGTPCEQPSTTGGRFRFPDLYPKFCEILGPMSSRGGVENGPQSWRRRKDQFFNYFSRQVLSFSRKKCPGRRLGCTDRLKANKPRPGGPNLREK